MVKKNLVQKQTTVSHATLGFTLKRDLWYSSMCFFIKKREREKQNSSQMEKKERKEERKSSDRVRSSSYLGGGNV